MIRKWQFQVAFPVAAALAGCLALATPALATPTVQGMDMYLDTQAPQVVQGIDILRVEGVDGEVVYFNIEKDGQVIADRLAYTLGTVDDDSTGVVSVSIDNFDPAATYTVRVYANREETLLVYKGDLKAITAPVEGKADHVIGYSTTNDTDEATREHNLPGTIKIGEDVYVLNGSSYELEATALMTVDGEVSYFDAAIGSLVKTEPILDVQRGTSRNVSIPGIIEADGRFYRTIFAQGSVTASYPGVRHFKVPVRELPASAAEGQGFYTALINLVDQDGTLLAADSVTVAGRVSYTAPTTLYRGSADQVVTYRLVGDPTLELVPAAGEDERTFSIAYERQDASASAIYSVVRVAVNPESKSRVVLGTDEVEVSPENPSATYDTPQSVMLDGVEYVPANAQVTYTYTWGTPAEPQRVIYYVPAGYVASENYNVGVAYVNIATGETIDTKTYGISPDMRTDLLIETPAQFVGAGGTTYVRLGGQEEPISHGYYTRYNESGPTYTVYYRDINDDLNRDRVVTRVRVTYRDLGTTTTGETGVTTTVIPGTTTTTTTTTATNTAPAATDQPADATATTGIPVDTTVSAIDGAEGSEGTGQTLVNGSGNDLNTQRIEDNETPLANGGNSFVSELASRPVLVVAMTVGLAALAVFLLKRRHRASDGSAN